MVQLEKTHRGQRLLLRSGQTVELTISGRNLRVFSGQRLVRYTGKNDTGLGLCDFTGASHEGAMQYPYENIINENATYPHTSGAVAIGVRFIGYMYAPTNASSAFVTVTGLCEPEKLLIIVAPSDGLTVPTQFDKFTEPCVLNRVTEQPLNNDNNEYIGDRCIVRVYTGECDTDSSISYSCLFINRRFYMRIT